MDWSIQEIAKLAGTTSRTLRHYDEPALVRLQRIMLLRQLGLGLPSIGEVLDREESAPHALRSHPRIANIAG